MLVEYGDYECPDCGCLYGSFVMCKGYCVATEGRVPALSPFGTVDRGVDTRTSP